MCRDYFEHAPSQSMRPQWKTTLQWNVVSHWLGAFTKWSLYNVSIIELLGYLFVLWTMPVDNRRHNIHVTYNTWKANDKLKTWFDIYMNIHIHMYVYVSFTRHPIMSNWASLVSIFIKMGYQIRQVEAKCIYVLIDWPSLLQVISLQWRHNVRDGVSNHQPHDCLLNRLFRRRSKKTSKLRVTGLCVGNSPVTGEFPAQMASNAENVSIWWRHHITRKYIWKCVLRNAGNFVSGPICLHIEAGARWPPFRRRYLDIHFL